MPDDIFQPEPDVDTHANQAEYGDVRNQLAVQMLKKVRDSITHVIQLFEQGDSTRATRQLVDFVTHNENLTQEMEMKTGSRVLEGVFDGEMMVGSDGARYQVPENYASKSRLVEGDILKLTIQPDGTHVYKQIGPVERRRLIGKLAIDPSTQEYVVACCDQVYKVITASVTYFKAVPGDEVVIVVPRAGGSNWAAVESVVSK